MKQRTYIDTSVIGGCEDSEFAEWSLDLFSEFLSGERVAVVSDLTRFELERAPEAVRKRLSSLPEACVENVSFSEEAEILTQNYLKEKIVGSKHLLDAQHIALATTERVDVLTSWNFKQIVNLGKIRAFNAVNLREGYPLLEVRSPREVLYGKEV